MHPAFENNLSVRTDVAGIIKYFLANLERVLSSGNRDQKINGSESMFVTSWFK